MKGIRLGDLSMRYETGYVPGQENLAAAKVSSGRGDPGGVSYGAYQLESVEYRNNSKVKDFLATDGSPWREQFTNLDPTVAGGDFEKKWKAVADDNPTTFFNAQHAYIKRTNYSETVRKVFDDTGINLDAMSIAVRNVVWSTSVQHHGAPRIIENALHDLNATDMQIERSLLSSEIGRQANTMLAGNTNVGFLSYVMEMSIISFEADFIKTIYRERKKYIQSNKGLGAALKNSLNSRYDSEQKDALVELSK